jgi:hypothetical protein
MAQTPPFFARPIKNSVWNVGTLSWEPMTQPLVNAGTVSVAGPLAVTSNLSIPAHDYVSLAYTGDNLTTVVFKTGGAGGTTVATLTLAYSGSTLTSVTKS